MRNLFHIFAGVGSQTAIASKIRFPDIGDDQIIKVNWEDLQKIQQSNEEFHCIYPIWNCNQGYIAAAKLENTIFEYLTAQNISISDIWPKNIQFSSAYKSKNINNSKKVISVMVAKLQCSDWLLRMNKFDEDSFHSEDSTAEAVKVYLENPEEFHSVLCTVDQIGINHLKEIENNIQNKFNYTTFIRTNLFKEENNTYNTFLYTLTISTSLKEISLVLSSLIESLVDEAESIESIPRIPFIINLGADLDGVIFEVNNYNSENTNVNFESIIESLEFARDEMDEELNFIGNIGNLQTSFNDEVEKFHEANIDPEKYFVKYVAPSPEIEENKKATLYAVPGFKIYIHGYGETIVKKVAIQYIKTIYNKINSKRFKTLNTFQFKTFQKIEEILRDKRDFSNIEFDSIEL